MDLLWLSHCVPNPPDKGEKIRAYHMVRRLAAGGFKVHVVCYARSAAELEQAKELEKWCASVYAEPFAHRDALMWAAIRFLIRGQSLNAAYYHGHRVTDHINGLVAKYPIGATVAFTAAMAPLAPFGIPLLLDMVDVDSAKWFQYAEMRTPSWLYGWEGRRLRRLEVELGQQAKHVWLVTAQELALYQTFANPRSSGVLENGVDSDYFSPDAAPFDPELSARRFVVFVGTMDYFPNHDGVVRFASEVMPVLRRQEPDLEFYAVGRNPPPSLKALDGRDGIHITGTVPDVRPYLRHAAAFVAPLRLARGIQNKVLEALSMGLPALVSTAVRDTFGDRPPLGVIHCNDAESYARNLFGSRPPAEQIRSAAAERFRWENALRPLDEELARLA